MADILKFVPKSWGYEKWIANSEKYCLKLLHVVKGRGCSVHYHKLKDETFYIQRGMVKVFTVPSADWSPSEVEGMDDKGKVDWWYRQVNDLVPSMMQRGTFQQGDIIHLPPLTLHRFIALRDTDIFEVSTQHFDEDSYRIIQGDN